MSEAKERSPRGLLERGEALSFLCQSLEQQSARRRGGERLGEPISEREEEGGEGAEERSKAPPFLPEARAHSMSKGQSEEEGGESSLLEALPGESAKGGEKLRDGRKGGSLRARERSKHESKAKEREHRCSHARQ